MAITLYIIVSDRDIRLEQPGNIMRIIQVDWFKLWQTKATYVFYVFLFSQFLLIFL